MGQYHLTVNLDKRQFLDPHKLGDGLKLMEQCGSRGGVADALILLLAVSNGRGGGDTEDGHEVVGSWGGDRIAIVGDYAEPGDLAPEHRANLIYGMCRLSGETDEELTQSREHWEKQYPRYGTDELEPSLAETTGLSWDEYLAEARKWRDISADILPLLHRELGIAFVGKDDGWRHRVQLCWSHKDKVEGHLDCNGSAMSEAELDLQLRYGVPPNMLGITAAQAKARNDGWSKR